MDDGLRPRHRGTSLDRRRAGQRGRGDAHASNAQGLWLDSWWGGPIRDRNTQPNMFRTIGGTTSLYAWLAYYDSASPRELSPRWIFVDPQADDFARDAAAADVTT